MILRRETRLDLATTPSEETTGFEDLSRQIGRAEVNLVPGVTHA